MVVQITASLTITRRFTQLRGDQGGEGGNWNSWVLTPLMEQTGTNIFAQFLWIFQVSWVRGDFLLCLELWNGQKTAFWQAKSVCRIFLDEIKQFVYSYFHWIPLVLVFSDGIRLSSPIFLSAILIVLSFINLWRGADLYLSDPKVFIRKWRLLTLYLLIVLYIQIAATVYSQFTNIRWIPFHGFSSLTKEKF